MFLSFFLAAAVAVIPPEVDQVVGALVDGFQRHDRLAVRGRHPLRNSLGTSYDRLLLYDDVHIDSWRIVSAEPAAEGLFLNVEMEGTATVIRTGEHARWPRRWSIHVVQLDGKWVVDTALMTERRLAESHLRDSPEELSRIFAEDPGLDFAAFTYFLADFSSSTPGLEPRPTFLWMLREGEARGEPAVQALAYQMLSWRALQSPKNPEEALANAERSLPYAEASGDAQVVSLSYHDIGLAYAAAGRIDDAVAALRRAASYYDRSFDPRDATRAQDLASELEMGRNNLRQALVDAELYQTMIGERATPRQRILGTFRIAEIHDRLGNTEIALRFYEQAYDLARRQFDPEYQLISAQRIAREENALGNTDRARAVLEGARAFYPAVIEPGYGYIVINQTAIAAMQLDIGELGESEKALDEALAVIATKPVAPEIVADVYVQRSRLRLVQGRPDEALADARTAHEKAGSPRADALTEEGRALRMLSRDAAAEEVLRAAIDVVEAELSKLPVDETGSGTVLAAKLGPYRELLDLLVEQGCAREALTVAEGMRARSLRETLEHGRVDLSAGLDAAKRDDERAREQALVTANRNVLAARGTAELARLQQQRDEARLALQQFRSELYAAHPDLDRRRAQGELLQPAIPAGELVLELAVLDHAAFVFALHDRDVAVHRIAISREALERQIDELLAAIEQRDLGYSEHARALYDLLLAPVATQLRAATSLRIVPDGASWRLPFHTLVDRRGKHLIERMPVAYSPSLAMARAAAVRPSTRRTLLAYGDPAVRVETAQATRSLYRDVDLGRLPDAASEARTIARLYGDARVRIGADAREAAFKTDAPAYRVLHLATHSIIDDRAPMFSSIVLSASGRNPLEDGLLEAREIAELDLHADLAVLSACDTARGAVSAGEGVVGLSWAFLVAGVPTTVVSQWKVASASTAELMIDFHRRLRGGQDAAEALRTAMLVLRHDPRWRHPFYWAPFTVIENSGIPSERQ